MRLAQPEKRVARKSEAYGQEAAQDSREEGIQEVLPSAGWRGSFLDAGLGHLACLEDIELGRVGRYPTTDSGGRSGSFVILETAC